MQDGAYTDTLSFAGWEDADPSRGALFIHNAERAGTYKVRVALSQYQPWVQDGVQVLGQRCHVHPAVVVAELAR